LRKTDLAVAQVLEVFWAVSSLSRILHVRTLRRKHPFYETLASCVPLLLNLTPLDRLRKLFVEAPFVSLLLNPRSCSDYGRLARRLNAVPIPTPRPRPAMLAAGPLP